MARAATAAVALVSMVGCCDLALSQSFAPARLTSMREVENLKCPRAERLSPVLFCQLIIDESGKALDDSSTHCFGNLGDDSRRATALRAKLLKSPFAPATIDGTATKVYASFRVFFRKTDDVCNVTVVPNLGTQQDVFGLDYSAPQEIYVDDGWLGRIPPSERSWRTQARTGTAFAMSVAVDEFGRATDGRVELNNFTPDEAVDRAVRSLEASRFVPLIVDGEPRAGRYFEFMYIHPLDPLR